MPAKKYYLNVNYDSPGARKALTKLHLVDIITGQGDRNWGNFFLSFDEKGEVTGATGIDNDLSFGKNYDSAHKMYLDDQNRKYVKMADLPPVIDTDMKKAVDGLSLTDFENMLSGWLLPEEINAAMLRLQELKSHLASAVNASDLIKNGSEKIQPHVEKIAERNKSGTPPPPLLVEPDQWGAEAVGAVLDSQNSYSGRWKENLAATLPDKIIDLTRTNQVGQVL